MGYDELLIEAEKLDVIVREKDLKSCDGLCKGNRIAINKKLKHVEKSQVLAEELGHYHKTVGNIIDQTKISNYKQERLARGWAYEKLMPLHKMIDAYKHGCANRYEIADFIGITEPFFDASIKYYKEKYGQFYKCDKYLICLDPLGIIEWF